MSDSEHTSDREDPQIENRELMRSVEEEMSARNAALQLRRDSRAARRRGRQPAVLAQRTRELRLTPPDGLPIDEWFIDAGITKLLAAEEGGTGTGKALHYHAVIETTYSDDSLKGWIRRVLRIPMSQALGNAVYRTGAPHEATYQYVVKCHHVVVQHGYTDQEIAEWMRLSDEYRTDIAAQRRALQRLRSQGRQRQLKTVEDLTLIWARENQWALTDPTTLVRQVLHQCHTANVEFPTKSQMETMVNRVQWLVANDTATDPRRSATLADRVVEYYARALVPRQNFSQ